MNELTLVLGAIIAIGAMLVISIPAGHVANASSCSSSVAHGGGAGSGKVSSGSCSSVGISGQGAITLSHLTKAYCIGTSSGGGGPGKAVIRDFHTSSSAVSCVSHFP